MKKNIWDIFAPFYTTFMKFDRKIYRFMERRISKVIHNKEVLEIACGPGVLSKKVSTVTKKMIASDYSEGMLKEARKGNYPSQLTFEKVDAMNLPYEDHSFDVVMINNALHLVPDPIKVLSEINRVLKNNGVLIAGNYVEHNQGFLHNLWTKQLEKAGVTFQSKWSKEEYLQFLEDNGWKVLNQKEFHGSLEFIYTECLKKE